MDGDRASVMRVYSQCVCVCMKGGDYGKPLSTYTGVDNNAIFFLQRVVENNYYAAVLSSTVISSLLQV